MGTCSLCREQLQPQTQSFLAQIRSETEVCSLLFPTIGGAWAQGRGGHGVGEEGHRAAARSIYWAGRKWGEQSDKQPEKQGLFHISKLDKGEQPGALSTQGKEAQLGGAWWAEGRNQKDQSLRHACFPQERDQGLPAQHRVPFLCVASNCLTGKPPRKGRSSKKWPHPQEEGRQGEVRPTGL